ncbi:YbjN domain-containing protein [Spirochaetia bacterium 38H-sp]|uniref:YbjN domain-containing protein n=1 Tax=Rarispira pelagica TaxID=3141764 RepID=A0ABU9U8W3_9SPIR
MSESMVDFSADNIMEVFTGLGYNCAPQEGGFLATQKGQWNLLALIAAQYDELQLVTYFTSKKGNDRTKLINAVNEYNRKTTLTTCKVDNEGNVYVSRTLPCRGGVPRTQLIQLIKEGDSEVNTFGPPILGEFVE